MIYTPYFFLNREYMHYLKGKILYSYQMSWMITLFSLRFYTNYMVVQARRVTVRRRSNYKMSYKERSIEPYEGL